MRALFRANNAVVKKLNRAAERRDWRVAFAPVIHMRYRDAPRQHQHVFHWGVQRVRHRYQLGE